jgi:hypothetical protein
VYLMLWRIPAGAIVWIGSPLGLLPRLPPSPPSLVCTGRSPDEERDSTRSAACWDDVGVLR